MEEKVYIPCKEFAGFNHLKISAMYDKGEWRRPRGYYLNITAVNITPEYGVSMEMWSSNSPYKTYLVEQVERKNPNRFNEFVEKMNRNAQKIAEAFVAKRFEEVWQYV